MFGVIYKITNKIDGKKYIGQTTRTIKTRWEEHRHNKRYNIYLYSAIRKHGKDNFEIKALSYCNSLEEMNHRERYYIKLFNTLAPEGYNLSPGGGSKICTEETRRKMSNSHRIRNLNLPKLSHTDAAKKRISESRKGTRMSDGTKAKISKFQKGVPKSEEQKIKMSLAQKGRNKSPQHIENMRVASHGKAVIRKEDGEIFVSIKAAARSLSVDANAIVWSLSKPGRTCKGFTFYFL